MPEQLHASSAQHAKGLILEGVDVYFLLIINFVSNSSPAKWGYQYRKDKVDSNEIQVLMKKYISFKTPKADKQNHACGSPPKLQNWH